MKRLLPALLTALVLPATVYANIPTIKDFKKIDPKPYGLVPFGEIEGANSTWRSYCQSHIKENNDWVKRFNNYAEKELRRQGKDKYYIKGFLDASNKSQLRNLNGCDCFIEKRIISLDTLSKKAADALLESQASQCMYPR